MPFRFDPPDLRDRWTKALRVLADHCDDEYWPHTIDPDFEKWESEHEDEVIFSEETILEYLRPKDKSFDGGYYPRTVREVLRWAAEIPSAKMHDRTIYVAPGRALVHVIPNGEVDPHWVVSQIVDGERLYETWITHKGVSYRVCLTFGLTPFAFFIGPRANSVPVVDDLDTFVEISLESKILPLEAVHEVTAAYLFALCVSVAGCDYVVTPFRETEAFELAGEDSDWEAVIGEVGPLPAEGTPDDVAVWYRQVDTVLANNRARETVVAKELLQRRREMRMRPAPLGPGMADVYALFHRGASGSIDDEYRVLCFAKVLEYVALTAVKQKSHGEIRKRLLDPRAIAPDARFIEDLIQLVDAQRNYRKDADALRLGVREFADPVTLALLATPALTALKGCTQSTSDTDKEKALDELAGAISATRNQIAHGKANYTMTGKECPLDQLEAFVVLLRSVAMQAISWFAGVPETARVTRG